MGESRFFRVGECRYEARFFVKGDTFPDTELSVSRQGVWARPADAGWEQATFVATSWRHVSWDSDVRYLPTKRGTSSRAGS
jgi:hypothetical protein